jgi:pimeloyl-ACP methyl ester carboxylesterase
MDHGRDLLHMINHFRAEMPLPLIGIGHSIGTVHIVNLSLMHPRLLTTVILLDTVIQAHHAGTGTGTTAVSLVPDQGRAPAQASTFRRDLWPSHSTAAETFTKSGFYQSWDARVLTRWLAHGLRDTPTTIYPSSSAAAGSATLTTTKHQEVLTFLRPRYDFAGAYDAAARAAYPDMNPLLDPRLPFYRPEPPLLFARLPSLRPSALYIFGGTSYMSTPNLRREKLGRTGVGIGGSGGVQEGRVKGEVLDGVGHLVAMEAPARCADMAAPWIGVELQRWRRELEHWREWTKKPPMEKVTVSEKWKEMLVLPKTSRSNKL